MQLIMAGKAHPVDQAGQALIQQWTQFIRRPEIRPHAIFLSDYDMLVTEHLVQGVDVWINTPRRPWEARPARSSRRLPDWLDRGSGRSSALGRGIGPLAFPPLP